MFPWLLEELRGMTQKVASHVQERNHVLVRWTVHTLFLENSCLYSDKRKNNGTASFICDICCAKGQELKGEANGNEWLFSMLSAIIGCKVQCVQWYVPQIMDIAAFCTKEHFVTQTSLSLLDKSRVWCLLKIVCFIHQKPATESVSPRDARRTTQRSLVSL